MTQYYVKISCQSQRCQLEACVFLKVTNFFARWCASVYAVPRAIPTDLRKNELGNPMGIQCPWMIFFFFFLSSRRCIGRSCQRLAVVDQFRCPPVAWRSCSRGWFVPVCLWPDGGSLCFYPCLSRTPTNAPTRLLRNPYLVAVGVSDMASNGLALPFFFCLVGLNIDWEKLNLQWILVRCKALWAHLAGGNSQHFRRPVTVPLHRRKGSPSGCARWLWKSLRTTRCCCRKSFTINCRHYILDCDQNSIFIQTDLMISTTTVYLMLTVSFMLKLQLFGQ